MHVSPFHSEIGYKFRNEVRLSNEKRVVKKKYLGKRWLWIKPNWCLGIRSNEIGSTNDFHKWMPRLAPALNTYMKLFNGKLTFCFVIIW